MLRIICLAAAALALAACGAKNDVDEATPGATDPGTTSNAYIEYNGKRYDLSVSGECGARPDGTYLTWAVSIGADGQPDPDAAHLYAMREAHWSVIDFYSPDDDKTIRIYRDGRDRIAFENGVLDFAGELGAGLTATATVHIDCPEQTFETHSNNN